MLLIFLRIANRATVTDSLGIDQIDIDPMVRYYHPCRPWRLFTGKPFAARLWRCAERSYRGGDVPAVLPIAQTFRRFYVPGDDALRPAGDRHTAGDTKATALVSLGPEDVATQLAGKSTGAFLRRGLWTYSPVFTTVSNGVRCSYLSVAIPWA